MSKKMAGIIMAYGGGLAALGFAIQAIAPTPAQVAVLTGLTGGGACILWGVVAWCGYPRRAWVIMTMVVIALCGLSQAVPAWLALAMKSGSLAVTLLMTLMLVATVGMIMYVLHGERPPEFYEASPGRHALPREDSSSKQPRRPH
jgi:hypothetical protein